MSGNETLTVFLAPFIHQLVKSGVRDVVISPGSRSTPLTVLFKEHPEINLWMNVDERSAAFFALGIAKASHTPVALVCSSGTASANYYPAIIEAKYSEIPLIVLTADRPHELREVGAPQAIDQIKLYGSQVKYALDLPLPESSDHIGRYMTEQADHAVRMASSTPKGPVHLNFPFREPLMPNVTKPIPWKTTLPIISHYSSENVLSDESLEQLAVKLSHLKRPLIIVGPQFEGQLGSALHQLAAFLNAPILADPLSQVRAGMHSKEWVAEGYDAFLRHPDFIKTYQADGMIRFGPMPVSKPLTKYIERLNLDVSIVISDGGRMSDPTQQVTEWVKASSIPFIQGILQKMADAGLKTHADPRWAKAWLDSNAVTRAVTERFIEESPWFEGHVVTELIHALPEGAAVFASNSMPIRDLDSFFLSTDQSIQTFGNRGANGIDGINSTALGMATQNKPAYLIIGDLSFFHDTNGLMVGRQYDIDLTCLIVNNNGGGIFSFLPQAETAEHFEELFATPLELAVEDVAKLYKTAYFKATNRAELKVALRKAKAVKGIKLIECQTVRSENVERHHSYWNEVKNALLLHKGDD